MDDVDKKKSFKEVDVLLTAKQNLMRNVGASRVYHASWLRHPFIAFSNNQESVLGARVVSIDMRRYLPLTLTCQTDPAINTTRGFTKIQQAWLGVNQKEGKERNKITHFLIHQLPYLPIDSGRSL